MIWHRYSVCAYAFERQLEKLHVPIDKVMINRNAPRVKSHRLGYTTWQHTYA
jgi:hypothetical protein